MSGLWTWLDTETEFLFGRDGPWPFSKIVPIAPGLVQNSKNPSELVSASQASLTITRGPK